MVAWRVLTQQVTRLHSVTALRKALRLFRAAVHSTDDEKTGEETSTATVRLASSPVYQDVIRFAITDLPAVFSHHLSLPASSASSSSPAARKLSSHPRWSVLGPLLQSYLTQFLHLLVSQSDPALLRLLLDTLLRQLVPFLEPFPRLPPRLLKRLVLLWATADRSTRIDAFLCIRQLCLTLTRQGVLELAMKSMYLTYVQRARHCSALTIGVLELMANCVVELYCMDALSAYQHAFVYIRQLAIHLRNAIHSGKAAGRGAGGGKAGAPDAGADDGDNASKRGKQKRGGAGRAATTGSYAAVYNWQFINCLRLWTKLLSSPLAAHPVVAASSSAPPPASTLRPLLYPFVQVCLGVATLLPSSRYHPLRLQVCAFLTSLSSSCHLFIPVLPVLLSLFSSSELTRRPSSSSSSTKSPDLRFCLRVSKQTAASLAYQQQLSSLALQSVLRYCAVQSYSLAFCELILPTTRFLRRWCKQSRIHRLRKEIMAVVAQLEHSSDWLRERRERSEFTPKDAVDGKVDSMFAFRQDGKDEAQRSPLERYLAMDRGPAGDGRVDDKDADWEGSATKGKRAAEGEDDEAADDEDEEDGEMDVDMDDDDEEEDEDEDEDEEEEEKEVAAKKKRKTGQKPAAAAVAGSQNGRSSRPQSQHSKTKLEVAEDGSAAAADEEDIVTELVLSDDDDD